MHKHKLRPVMEAVKEEERKARMAEIESLEEGLTQSRGLGEGRSRWEEEGGMDDGGQKTRRHCYVDQTEWMGIRMAEKGRVDGFW